MHYLINFILYYKLILKHIWALNAALLNPQPLPTLSTIMYPSFNVESIEKDYFIKNN